MQIDIVARPAASAARLTLDAGERVICEVGTMIAMSTDLRVQTLAAHHTGGILQGVRRMLAGESFLLNEFTAERDGSELLVGPGLPGDITHHAMRAGALFVQATSWLAAGPGIDIDAGVPSVGKALFSRESLFWVKCSGHGDVLLSSFGAIYAVDIDGSYVVDTGHVVAYEDTLAFSLAKANPTWLGSFLGGEGLVCRFEGQGRLYCQSHNPPNFGRLVGPMLRPK